MMKMDAIELAQLAQADAEPRYDIYAGIHKAARAMFADALLALGRMDADDDAERADALARLDALINPRTVVGGRYDAAAQAGVDTEEF